MSNIRVKDLATTATSPAADDVAIIDGATGTRKINAGPLGGVFDENITTTGQIQVAGGAVASPSYAFVGDVDSGMSRPTSDAVNIVTGGAERLRVDSSGRLLVGTTTSTAKLHVVGSDASGGTFKFVDGSSRTLQDLSGGALSWSAASVIGGTSWAGTADHEIKTLTTARDTLLVTGPASGSEHALHVTGLQSYFEGNLGIGLSSPSAGAVGGKVVHVQSTGETASVRVDRSDASTAGTLSLTAGNSTLGVYGTGAKPIAFSTNGTERLRLDASGRIGQAGITPGSYHANADNLVIANDGLSGDSGLTIRSGTSGGGSIYFADGTTGDQRYRGYMSYAQGIDALQFGSAGAERMRITSSGNLAINRTSAGAKIDVATAANSNGFFLRDESDSSITHNVYIDASGNGVTKMYADGAVSKIQLNTAGDSYFLGGNTGFGQTSPSTKVDVNGILTIDTDYAPGSAVGGLALGDYQSGGYKWVQSMNSQPLVLNPLGNNVGIGCSPTATLEITDATTNVAAVRVTRRSDLASTYLEMGTTGGSGQVRSTDNLVLSADPDDNSSSSAIEFEIDGSEVARLEPSGRLGLGLTTPQELVHLYAASGGANNRVLSRSYFGAQHSDHSLVLGYCAKADTAASSQMVVTETSGSGAGGNPAAIRMKTGTIEFHTAGSGTSGVAFNSQRAVIDSSGRLGVGQTSPGSFQGGANNLVVGDHSASNHGITIASGSSNYGIIYFSDGTTGNELYRGSINYNHSNDSLSLSTAGTTRWSINSSGNLAATGAYGIDFGQAPDSAAGATGSVLNDYEEGTATISDSSGAGLTYTGAACNYIKIGSQVTAWVKLTYPTTSNGNNSAIGGFPFAFGANDIDRVGGSLSFTTLNSALTVLPDNSTSLVRLRKLDGGTYTNAELSGKQVWFSVTYDVS